MVLHNPNNWHWVNKDVSQWTKDYLNKELIGLKAEKDGNSAEVSKVLTMDGDVDVSQRKGKVITIYDVKLQLEYTGKLATKSEVEGAEGDTTDVSGTITIPEVAHDTEEDEFVVCFNLYISFNTNGLADHSHHSSRSSCTAKTLQSNL
jgi:activator of HSP90 ATPase